MKLAPTIAVAIRLVSMALSAVLWTLLPADAQHGASGPANWYIPVVLIGFSGFSVVFLSVMQPQKEWVAPRWNENPFDMNKPLEGLHMCAWSFLAGSLAIFGVNALGIETGWHWGFLACIGLGLLAGIRIASIPEHRRGK